MSDAWVTLERFFDAVAAQVARSRLEAAGIEAHLADEGMGGMFSYGLIKGVRLQVPAADEERAREILETPAGDEPTESGTGAS